MGGCISSIISALVQYMTNAETDSLDVHGENHNFSGADEGNRSRCMLCSTSKIWRIGRRGLVRERTPLDIYQFLHGECSTCRLSDDSEAQLCGFCRHIRLRHFLSCLSDSNSEPRGYYFLELDVDFGDLDAVRSRQNCGLCRLVADTVSIHAQETPKGNRSSIPNFSKLKIETICENPRIHISSNLLKEEVQIGGKDLRRSDFFFQSYGSVMTREKLAKPLEEEKLWDHIRKSLPDIKPSPIGRLPSHFRLIDVQRKRCFTFGPSFNGTFAALSYVWGGTTGIDLSNPPRTIEDALHACQQLGQKYLWVDQICINQDDVTDKANQIASMAAIYSSASFVIVAARGKNAEFGLSGMSVARGKLQARESFLGFEFASVPNFNRAISSSIWSTRGWTLQEVVLNKVRLYFSSTGVWLSVEENGNDMQYSIDFQTKTTIVSGGHKLSMFSKFLQQYTSRKLTYEHDIYNAFSGIMEALLGGPEKNIYGLLEQHFDQALLWVPAQGGLSPGIRVFRNDQDEDTALNPLLPTWSWASVTGEVWITSTSIYDEFDPLVKWARITPRSQPRTPTLIEPLIEGHMWRYESTSLYKPQFHLAVLWSYSCFDSPSPFAPQPNYYTQSRLENIRQRWPSPQDFWHEVSSGSSRSPTYPGLDIPGLTEQDDPKIAQLQPGVLLTRAQSAHVWVDPNGYFRDNDHGVLIGQLYGTDRGLINRGNSPKAGVFTCIAISVARGLATAGLVEKRMQESGTRREYMLSKEDSWDLTFPQRRWKSNEPPPVINVMLIGREGEFSYRLGVGWILFRRWLDAERVFETILLK